MDWVTALLQRTGYKSDSDQPPEEQKRTDLTTFQLAGSRTIPQTLLEQSHDEKDRLLLHSLDLSGASFECPHTGLSGFNRLQRLRLSNCSLRQLDKEWKTSFPELNSLDLSSNNLHLCTDTNHCIAQGNLLTLAGLQSLVELKLHNNAPLVMHDSLGLVFSQLELPRLQTLSLANNALSGIFELTPKLENLQVLDISNNALTDISFVWKLPLLVHVNAANNSLYSLFGCFCSGPTEVVATKMINLNLRGNRFVRFPDISCFPCLHTLDLSCCQLEFLGSSNQSNNTNTNNNNINNNSNNNNNNTNTNNNNNNTNTNNNNNNTNTNNNNNINNNNNNINNNSNNNNTKFDSKPNEKIDCCENNEPSKPTQVTDLNLNCNAIETIPKSFWTMFANCKEINLTHNRVAELDIADITQQCFALEHLYLRGNPCEVQIAQDTNHSTIPFSICTTLKDEYPDEIVPHLYLGTHGAAKNLRILQELGVQSILTVAANTPPHFGDLFTYKIIPVEDEWSEDLLSHFASSIAFIETALQANHSILVHCAAGLSRSASVVIAYVMQSKKLGYRDALLFVREQRQNVAPNRGFQKQLLSWESQLAHPQNKEQ